MIELTQEQWQTLRQANGDEVRRSSLAVSCLEVMAALDKVKRITQSVFSANFACSEQEDCEIPGDRYFEFCVTVTGTVEDILARNDRWHQEISVLPEDLRGLFHLSIAVPDEGRGSWTNPKVRQGGP